MLLLEERFDVPIYHIDHKYLLRVNDLLTFILYGVILKRLHVERSERALKQHKFIKYYSKVVNPVDWGCVGQKKWYIMNFIVI